MYCNDDAIESRGKNQCVSGCDLHLVWLLATLHPCGDSRLIPAFYCIAVIAYNRLNW